MRAYVISVRSHKKSKRKVITMILYFSGTGNSEYAAKRIGRELQDEVLNLFERIRNHDYSEIHSDSPWVVVVPTYAWRIPRIVQEWLENAALTGNRDIYFVMTCGGSIGNAGTIWDASRSRCRKTTLRCFPHRHRRRHLISSSSLKL